MYDYFATHDKDGMKAMTSQDVVRALVPTYPPVGSDVVRAGFLDGERGHSQDAHVARKQLLHFFDHNQDGTISFNEFVLIVITLSVPEKDVEIVFDVMDLDNNGVIDPQEFQQVLEQLEKRAGLNQTFHARVGKHAQEMDNREMTHKLFEDHGGGVSLSRFKKFLERLQQNMLQLEFAHYDPNQRGWICGADFANSLVTAADIKVVDRYLDKVHELPQELAAAKIKYADFKSMAQLKRNMHMLSFALDFCSQVERPLTKLDFSKLILKTMGVKLSSTVLDIVFYMFNAPAETLDGPALVDTMKRRNRVPGYKGDANGFALLLVLLPLLLPLMLPMLFVGNHFKQKGRGLVAEEDRGSAIMDWFNCMWSCTFDSGQHLRLPQA
eukprot:gene11679-11822_t